MVGCALLFAACAGAPSRQPPSDYLSQDAAARYRGLEAASKILDSGKDVKDLDGRFPGFSKRLDRAHDPVLLSLWGRSSILDASSNRQILPDTVIQRLGIGSEVTPDGQRHVHAGLMHSYGYLFSTIETPYGRKGKRWIESRVDERIGIGPGRFAPVPARGEFLANLTWTLLQSSGTWGHVAPSTRRRIESLIAPDLASSRPAAVTDVIAESASAGGDSLTVKTAFVPLAPIPGLVSSDSYLLIYWTESPHETPPLRLITAFPVAASFRDKVLSESRSPQPFRPRYNLVLP